MTDTMNSTNDSAMTEAKTWQGEVEWQRERWALPENADTVCTLSHEAGFAADDVEDAMQHVASVVARARAALQRRSAGQPHPDGITDAAAALVDELDRLGPTLERVVAVLDALIDANEPVDATDPRTLARDARRNAAVSARMEAAE